jgi:anti-anti-sigma factor
MSPTFAFDLILGRKDVDGGARLEVRTEVAGGVAVYRIVGRLDASSSPILESAVGSAFGGGYPRIIFDMGEVTFISSAGLRIILKTAKQAAAAKGGLAIFGLQSAVNEVFEISGLQKFIPIASDEPGARAKVGGEEGTKP